MRSFTSMSSSSGFRARGRGARWQRSYSDRATAPTQQQSPPTNGAPAASSGSRTPNAHPNRPRGPHPYAGYYTPPPPPHGRGPAYSDGPSPQDCPPSSPYFFGPPAPGLGYSSQRPTQFRGQGPPYTGPQPRLNMQQYYNQQQPPQWFVPGTPNAIHGQAYAPHHQGMHQQPSVQNKLASYRRKWRLPPSPVPFQFGKMHN